jgi:hypothetical protein
VDPVALEEAYLAALQGASAEGQDPLLAAEEAAGELFLTWDDDSGGGLAAAFAFPVPADGDYRLVVASALTALGRGTFGDYRLSIGLDAPEMLTGVVTEEMLAGQDAAAGEAIAVLDRELAPPGEAVQEIQGALTSTEQVLELRDIRPGDTLYVFVEATAGEQRPAVELLNYANKPLRTANLTGQAASASLEVTLPEGGRNYKLSIAGCCDPEGEPGEYRLLIGVNEPQVLTGQAAPSGQPVVEQPIPVNIGIELQQIVEVDEQNEAFTAVANLRMEWTDPRLAFSPESCDCVVKSFSQDTFGQFVDESQGRWPDFVLHNQQENRWTQNRLARVSHTGQALYFERFSTDFQVDFDFRRYPFDRQQFIMIVDSVFPQDVYLFTDLEGTSSISAEHGEDEFIIQDLQTQVTGEPSGLQTTHSRFTFSFEGPRHLNYYLLQVFLPILLIAGVSWITFFLRDYGRRIEVASANLLVFIAFSFSLADNYPRLGYMTLLDGVMVFTFIINALVVAYNVWLRRLEMVGQGELAERIDNYLDWLYPLLYVAAVVVLYILFF